MSSRLAPMIPPNSSRARSGGSKKESTVISQGRLFNRTPASPASITERSSGDM